MTRRARWAIAGAALITAGVGLVFLGFVYDVLFAGIPYQDPPPELAAEYDRQARVAELISWLGVPLLVTGGVALLVTLFIGEDRRLP
ncbi:hypothetical protein [Reyranella sp. CPCC 100927]|uniref:hypothetical protein n=1 Tax=Reyranella sp. CPCC 100927 TaxID=2599616 RepID=UPI0011B502FE|nr:hypothetical protein [Reyranella sp. CPCC 100927]TWT14854.1 hypothetical protein FQU96_00355 [Reyranella sp. CPCC 100927]